MAVTPAAADAPAVMLDKALRGELGSADMCRCRHTRDWHRDMTGGCLECDCRGFATPERRATTGAPEEVVSGVLGPVLYAALLVAGRDERRLVLEATDCRAQ